MAEHLKPEVLTALDGALDGGEEMRGTVVATWSKTFSGGVYAIGVTDRRILLQALDRRGNPKEGILSIAAESVEDAKLDGAGDGWLTAPSAILDATAITLKLKTTDGEKLKLRMMHGQGPLGKLGGGDGQKQGVVALAEWVAANAPPR